MSIYGVGLRNVGSYQVSGQPFVTGSNMATQLLLAASGNVLNAGEEKNISFPFVTKKFTVWNYSFDPASKLRITYVPTGSITNYPNSGCYHELSMDESLTITAKCREVFISAVGGNLHWKIYGSLTNIPISSMYPLTGSGISE